MPFLTELRMKPAGDQRWELLDDFDYGTNDGVLIRVPAGFVSDLASIPRCFRVLIPVNGLHREAATLHDYLYDQQGVVIDRQMNFFTWYERKKCDELFLEAMISSAVPVWKRNLMYWAVRSFGWKAWSS